MVPRLRYQLLLIALLLLLSSCTPEPVFRLTPEKNPSIYHQGTEYITLEKNGISVTLAYYRHLQDMIAMDVEVLNRRHEPIRVDPVQFGAIAMGDHADSTFTDFLDHNWAYNPEKRLLEIDKAISRNHASQKTEQGLYLTTVALSATAAILSDSEHDRQQFEEEAQEDYVDHKIREADLEYEKMDLEKKRDLWKLETLRITDLEPDNYIRGLVFFPNKEKAKGYKFEFNIDGTTFVAWYKQHKYKP